MNDQVPGPSTPPPEMMSRFDHLIEAVLSSQIGMVEYRRPDGLMAWMICQVVVDGEDVHFTPITAMLESGEMDLYDPPVSSGE